MSQVDFRAKITAKGGDAGAEGLFGPDTNTNILQPLRKTNGVIFPYTPSITTGNEAEYDQTSFVHTNYGYNAYIKSNANPLGITAKFSAQNIAEAYYMLAVLHFFRVATKSYFGVQTYNKAGTPPPTVLFSYLGDYLFSNVPVVIKSFTYTLPDDVDYIPVNTCSFSSGNITGSAASKITTKQGWTYVPTLLTVSATLDTQYTPYVMRTEFNLDKFRTGKLMNQGWI